VDDEIAMLQQTLLQKDETQILDTTNMTRRSKTPRETQQQTHSGLLETATTGQMRSSLM